MVAAGKPGSGGVAVVAGEVVALLRHALSLFETQLGPNHPHTPYTAEILSDLAAT